MYPKVVLFLGSKLIIKKNNSSHKKQSLIQLCGKKNKVKVVMALGMRPLSH